MGTYASDTTLTSGRGSPNAVSPGSDGNNWFLDRGNQTPSFTGSQIVGTYLNTATLGVWIYSTLSENVVEVLVNVTPSSLADTIGAILCFQNSNNFYYCDIGNLGQKIEIGKNVAGTFTSLVSTGFSWTAATRYTIRFQYGITTNTLNAKIWLTSGSEPGPWTLTWSDSSLATGGGFGVCLGPAGSQNCAFDTFSATSGALTTNAMNSTDVIPAADTSLFLDQALPVDALSLADSFASGGQVAFLDLLAASDTYLAVDQFAWVDLIPASDSFVYLDLHAMTSTDLLVLADNFQAIGVALPLDQLAASDSYLAVDQSTWLELIPASDSFSASSLMPPPHTTITWVTRDGLVSFKTRDGQAVFTSRDDQITWKARG